MYDKKQTSHTKFDLTVEEMSVQIHSLVVSPILDFKIRFESNIMLQ